MSQQEEIKIDYSGWVIEHDSETRDYRGHVNFIVGGHSDKIYQIWFRLGEANRLVAWGSKKELLCSMSTEQEHKLNNLEQFVADLLSKATEQTLKLIRESPRQRSGEYYRGMVSSEIQRGSLTLIADKNLAALFRGLLPRLEVIANKP